ncbi:signal peptidase I [Virgibacillus sp. MSJ-26]|uniref:signal peptidase I n=1 Tax=Virgibacillus sp. MSJ-26 TaxID=2841522 RepID=UPI001C115ADF|nr:signal peptidase I [Virgibacillus sp. MSJ-26]
MIGIEDEKSTQKEQRNSIISWIKFILILVGIFLIFRFVIGITVINGQSMSPTFSNNNVIMTTNLFYSPEKGDIILYRDENGFDVIKRVIATENDHVEIKDGVTKVNGKPLQEEYKTGVSQDMSKVVVDENSYFVLGDNRSPGESLDSRNESVGTIAKADIKGRYLFKLYPF